MNEFERQFTEVRDLLRFDDYPLVVKRIIDFTLDTADIAFYQKANTLLDWLDSNVNHPDTKQKLDALLDELYATLINKPLSERYKILEATEVKKSYSAAAFALGPVNLELFEGDIVGLVGENGNGKTTLLRLLCGELYATAGQVIYNFTYKDLYDLRTKLVYIPQRTDTWRGSMYENLVFTAASYGYSPEENNLIVELIIARLGLRKFRKHSWKNLSSGYKMRFELARMLLRKPKVLLIDEPLANLDILAQQTVLEDFRAIAKSPFRPMGIILSSQQLYEVEKTSDQVIFLKNGVQKNLYDAHSEDTQHEKQLVIEFESEWTQNTLNDVLQELNLVSLQFNGGTYIATFTSATTVTHFLKLVIDQQVPLGYFRNISNSTRRFFVS
ncbi:ABC transporter ATP-binding protein [Flavobacterium subsaxonicum]|uniref:ABC transporter ATP-binding protein n=1 Tax=Flavobacterium subsaxonicum WB 4.1-42 = DSM 21790 TaxID=1121898 RepID=A0A0A2MHU3_9FLAO|nr:ABC transporter ATP-binding protein [Flavobacterium subsaxonicum]KGO91879.1 ABC transporter ATP-binding protein [Flavobacterium subsaxonicum WB 4.1-42 = DSM 21790]